MMYKENSYGEVIRRNLFYDMQMCFDFSLRQNGVGQSEDNYDPLKDGYITHTISKSAKIYLCYQPA